MTQKMEPKIFAYILLNGDTADILTNYGDICNPYSNGEHIVNGYYQSRFTEKDKDGDFPDLDSLLERSKLYCEDYESDTEISDKHIDDCIFGWMCHKPDEVVKIKVDGIGLSHLVDILRVNPTLASGKFDLS